jgi:hypothetical protein
MAKKREYDLELKAQEPALIKRAGGKCEANTTACGKGFRMYHRHHRLMRSHGGTNDLDNLMWVCDGCHTYIHNHPKESYEKGWLIRSTYQPWPNGNGQVFPS